MENLQKSITEKEIYYYTPIKFDSILKNDNWRKGGNAITSFSNGKEFKFQAEISVFGKTKKEAEDKLLNFLNSNGKIEIECINK